MGKFIMFKTVSDDAWFYFNPKNVLDTLRVVFVSECNENEDPSDAWQRFSEEAKINRIEAITIALTYISLDEVQFENLEAYRIKGDTQNLYDLLMVLRKHPSARLVHVLSRHADGITALDSDSYITVGQLLKTFAHFIAEDILDIEAELYAHTDDTEEKLSKLDSSIARCERVAGSDDKVVCAAKKARKRIADEMSPVEDFKAFMKAQYDKHEDEVDAIVDAYDYINNDIVCTRETVNDPVNHPKHYQASNGLEAIDCIEAFVEDLPGDMGYLIGNAMKYLCRFDKKGKPVEDLCKAKWYIERAIKNIESRKM